MLAFGMSERDFLEPAAKQRTADMVRAVEAQSAVELVVAVRRAAAHHFGISLGFGAACALVGLAVMWFGPGLYDVRTMPLDAGLAFVLGVALASSVTGLRRRLTPRASRVRSAERAARAAFFALGIEKTRGRTGLARLRRALRATRGAGPGSGASGAAPLEASLAAVGELLSKCGRTPCDLTAFLAALGRLGSACGAVLPRQADDENELCDDVA